MAQTDSPEVFSIKMLCKRWSCSENTVRGMIKTNKLKAFKVGNALLRIRLSEVLRWEHESAGSNTQLDNTGLAEKEAARSLSGTMKAANASKSPSAQQTKAMQELNSIHSRLKLNS